MEARLIALLFALACSAPSKAPEAPKDAAKADTAVVASPISPAPVTPPLPPPRVDAIDGLPVSLQTEVPLWESVRESVQVGVEAQRLYANGQLWQWSRQEIVARNGRKEIVRGAPRWRLLVQLSPEAVATIAETIRSSGFATLEPDRRSLDSRTVYRSNVEGARYEVEVSDAPALREIDAAVQREIARGAGEK